MNESSHIEDALRRVKRGDTNAFEVVIREYERPLRAWLAAQSSPEIDVDDVAQQSFVNAYLRLGEYKLGTNFSAWLYTIARYQLMTETTRLRRVADYRTRFAHDLLAKELERRMQEPSHQMEARLEHLPHCMERLESSLREFLSWRYREGISLEEMAHRSRRSVAAVKKQLWTLRQKLKDCIEARTAAAKSL